MGQVSDIRGTPGELVMLRTSSVSGVWDEPDVEKARQVGVARPKMLGLILSVAVPGWTYVLWSGPAMVMGWMTDGCLRRLNQRG